MAALIPLLLIAIYLEGGASDRLQRLPNTVKPLQAAILFVFVVAEANVLEALYHGKALGHWQFEVVVTALLIGGVAVITIPLLAMINTLPDRARVVRASFLWPLVCVALVLGLYWLTAHRYPSC